MPGRWEDALTIFGDQASLQTAMADLEKDPQSRALLSAVLGHTSCEVTAVNDHTVTVAMDTVNAAAVTGSVMDDAMGLAFMAAFSGPEGEKLMQQALTGKLTEALSSSAAPEDNHRRDARAAGRALGAHPGQ